MEEITQSPDNLSDTIQDARSIESTDNLKSVRTILECKNTSKILTDWTTNSDIYLPLVPISHYSGELFSYAYLIGNGLSKIDLSCLLDECTSFGLRWPGG